MPCSRKVIAARVLEIAVAITNLLSGLAGFVPMDDVGDALGGQEAL